MPPSRPRTQLDVVHTTVTAAHDLSEAHFTRFVAWSKLEPAPESARRGCCMCCACSAEAGRIVKQHFALGGAEGVAMILTILGIDKDNSGSISTEEREALSTKMSGDILNMLINMGVMGALALSIIYPFVIAPIEVSERARQFWDAPDEFGDPTRNVAVPIADAFTGIMTAAAAASLALIMYSTRMYTILSFWMTTPEMKLWFIQEVSIAPAITIQSYALGLTLLTFIWFFGVSMGNMQTRCLLQLHQTAHDLVKTLESTPPCLAHKSPSSLGIENAINKLLQNRAASVAGGGEGGGDNKSNAAIMVNLFVEEMEAKDGSSDAAARASGGREGNTRVQPVDGAGSSSTVDGAVDVQQRIFSKLTQAGLTDDRLVTLASEPLLANVVLREAGISLPGERVAIIALLRRFFS